MAELNGLSFCDLKKLDTTITTKDINGNISLCSHG